MKLNRNKLFLIFPFFGPSFFRFKPHQFGDLFWVWDPWSLLPPLLQPKQNWSVSGEHLGSNSLVRFIIWLNLFKNSFSRTTTKVTNFSETGKWRVENVLKTKNVIFEFVMEQKSSVKISLSGDSNWIFFHLNSFFFHLTIRFSPVTNDCLQCADFWHVTAKFKTKKPTIGWLRLKLSI